MASKKEYIRRLMNIEPTRDDKGLTTTITVTFYDSGMIAVNGTPYRNPRKKVRTPILSVGRLIMQMLEEMERQSIRRS